MITFAKNQRFNKNVMNDLAFFLPEVIDLEDKTSFLKNCIRKNYRHLRKWGKRTQTNCFRIYGREINAYPLTIDFYDKRFLIHFFLSNKDTSSKQEKLKSEVSSILYDLFNADMNSLFWRSRIKRQKYEQYEKIDATLDFFTVYENGVKFKVNLSDYLDTGLFLDHRETRQILAKQSSGKHLLNLFAYTGSFSVHAAMNGASFTKTIDMSNTYTAWARDNFRLNKLPDTSNEIIRADCLKFLDEEIRTKSLYDLIVIDPPTTSRSKKMNQMFDVQIDYISLILRSLKILKKNGTIYFSTNSRTFKFDTGIFRTCSIMEITHKTIPLDFHNKKIHRAWKITKI
jgi:23S rRNA (cytosine1962-C5)-methyltransferase